MSVSSDDDDMIGSLVEILIDRQRVGQPVELEAMCLQHPELAERLRSLYETIRVMEENKPSRDSFLDVPISQHASRIGDYQILREIARGGMGVVYEAIQLSLGRHVALKVIAPHLHSKKSGIARFRREARAAAQLHHSNIVPVFDVGQEDDVFYYAMQYIPGQSLDQVIDELRRSRNDFVKQNQPTIPSAQIRYRDWSGTVPQRLSTENQVASDTHLASSDNSDLERDSFASSSAKGTPFYRNVARIGQQIAEALAYAHGRGILHRDIKPSNILIDLTGTAWVTDFGLAKANDSSDVNEESAMLTQTGDIVGTLRYLAPECLQGKHDHRVDIYGLGATVYELLSQRPLFEAADRAQLLAMVSHHEPVSLRKLDAKLPRDLETIVQKCIAKDPQFRYRSAQTLVDDLRLFLLDRPIQSRRTTWMEKTSRWCRKNPAFAGLATLALTLLFVLASIFLVNKSLQRQRDEAIDLYQRTAVAENQARVRALLNDVATYRMTLEPELHSRIRRLNSIDADDLPHEERFALRNEIAACLTRADWFLGEVITRVDADIVAAIDRSHSRLAQVDQGKIAIRNLHTGKLFAENIGVGFVPTSIRFSRNGEYILAYGMAAQMEVLRCEDGKAIHAGPQIVLGCDVSDAADIAVYWHADQRVSIESIDRESAGKVLLDLHTNSQVTCCRVSRGGEKIAYAERGDICIIDSATGMQLGTWPCDQPSRIEWSPCGNYLAVVDAANQIQIWDVENSECVNILDSHASYISELDFHPSGQYLLSQTWDGTTQVTNAWSGRILVRSKKGISRPEFSTDGQAIGWNIAEGQLQIIRWHPGLAPDIPFNSRSGNSSPTSLAIHPHEKFFLVASSEQASLFDLATKRLLATIPVYQPVAMEFASKGSGLYVLGKNAIQFWPVVENASGTTTTVGPPQIRPIAAITTGFVVADSNKAIVTTENNSLAELNLQTGEIERTLGTSRGFTVVRLGDSECVLYQWLSPFLEFWNYREGKHIGQLKLVPGTQAFADPAFHRIFTTNSSSIQIWDANSLKRIRELELDAPLVAAQIAFDPSKTEMALQLAPHYLTLADESNYEPLLRLDSNFEAGYTSLQYTPSGDYLIGISPGTHAVRVWHLGQLRKYLGQKQLDWNFQKKSLVDMIALDSSSQSHVSQTTVDLGELGQSSQPRSALSLAYAHSQHKQQPDDPGRANNYAWQLLMAESRLRDDRLAESLAKRALDSASDEPTYRNTYAFALCRAGKFDEAEALLLKNLDTSAPNELTYDLVVLAMIAESRGQSEVAHRYSLWAKRNSYQHPPKLILDRQELKALFEELKRIPH